MIDGLSEKETNGDVDMLDALYMCTLDMITGIRWNVFHLFY